MHVLKDRYPIGIDIGQRDLYAAQVAAKGKSLAVRGLIHRAIGRDASAAKDRDGELVAVLKTIRKQGRFRGRRAVASLPPDAVIDFPVRFTVDREDDMEAAMVAEAGNRLSYPLSEAIIDYPSLVRRPSEAGIACRATVVSVRRDTVERYDRMFKQAGMVLETVDFNVSSLFRLYRHGAPAPAGALVVALIDPTVSMLSVISGSEILGHRSVDWGLQGLTDKLRVNFGHLNGDDHARFLLERYGMARCVTDDGGTDADPDIARAVFQVLTPPVEALAYEFDKLFSYIRSERPKTVLEKICLYGHAATVNGLDRYLSDRLGMPVCLMNPLADGHLHANGTGRSVADGSPYALALGLALRRVPWL